MKEDIVRVFTTRITDVTTGEVLYNVTCKDIFRTTDSFGRKIVNNQLLSFFRGILQGKELEFNLVIHKESDYEFKDGDLF